MLLIAGFARHSFSGGGLLALPAIALAEGDCWVILDFYTFAQQIKMMKKLYYILGTLQAVTAIGAIPAGIGLINTFISLRIIKAGTEMTIHRES
jgi:hypothetical protein